MNKPYVYLFVKLGKNHLQHTSLRVPLVSFYSKVIFMSGAVSLKGIRSILASQHQIQSVNEITQTTGDSKITTIKSGKLSHSSVADPGGARGACPPGPVKISHKKMAAKGTRIDFMFLAPPPPDYLAARSATVHTGQLVAACRQRV